MTKPACARPHPYSIIEQSPPAPHRQSQATSPRNGPKPPMTAGESGESMQAQTAKPTFLGNLTLFSAISALLSCIFTPFPVVSVQSLPQSRRAGTRLPSPKSPFTPLERDRVFVAGSATNVRPMRQRSALKNPSLATTLLPSTRPYAPLFRHSSDTKCPPMRPVFRSCSRYSHETMRPVSATKNFAIAMIFVSSATNTPSHALFSTATKCPGMRPHSPSWLRYNHETTETMATPSPEPVEGPHPTIRRTS